MPSESTVYVIDDDQGVRHSLSFLLETADFDVRTFDSASAFVADLDALEPGCVITDIRMPGMSGLDLLHHLGNLPVPLPVIVITGHGDVPLAVEAMKSGAIDFLEKPFNDEQLLRAVRTALERSDAERQREEERREVEERMGQLTSREAQVLQGLVAGHANKRIAFDLDISPRTVEIYRANVMTKMNAASLSDLVRMSLLVDGGSK
ncbi:response regulator FixJ [Consotaella salsifontis]|uniref:Two component transcriptional regulator, LuxR family n=1 Tax=Consotaella salsifontis TaxID=1365950 RepID=A0A1T4R918_9HYPH|nr:response regulator FixJ [Consotaella salsifontis]SKA12111.1 two component transcriptional regulator, LuxR family [Consotaella salsifontis]